MAALIDALTQLGSSLWELLTALFLVLVPWTPLLAWIVFWMFAVNWVKLRVTLARGGWVGVVLIGAIMVLVWGNIAPSEANLFSLHISNFVEKTVYVSGLYVIMFLAGALQLSGCCAGCCQFNEPILIAETHGHDAGHGHDAAHPPADSHGAHH